MEEGVPLGERIEGEQGWHAHFEVALGRLVELWEQDAAGDVHKLFDGIGGSAGYVWVIDIGAEEVGGEDGSEFCWGDHFQGTAGWACEFDACEHGAAWGIDGPFRGD